MAKPTGKPNGRPKVYSKALADRVLKELALGKTVRRACAKDGMPSVATVYKWLQEVEGFSERYFEAKEWGVEALADQVLDIADDGTNDFMEDQYMKGKTPGYQLNGENIQRSKLRVDTRLKLMSKLKPTKYGDKQFVEESGEKKIIVETRRYSAEEEKDGEK